MSILAVMATACSDDATSPAPEGSTPSTAASVPDVAPSETAPAAASVGEVDVTAAEEPGADSSTSYSFAVPATMTSGATEFRLTNTGAEAHHAQLFSVNDGANMDDVMTAMGTEDFATLFQLGAFAGGTGAVDPFGGTSSASAVVDLTPGTWLMLCLIPSADGVPHVAQGMLATIDVTASDNAAEVPAADVTIDSVDFGFVPLDLPSQGVVEFNNVSTSQIHELNLLQLADGATVDDVLAFYQDPASAQGPPPFSAVGGVNGIMPGARASFLTGLTPGSYAMVCFVPDPADGVPHAFKGMATAVTVA